MTSRLDPPSPPPGARDMSNIGSQTNSKRPNKTPRSRSRGICKLFLLLNEGNSDEACRWELRSSAGHNCSKSTITVNTNEAIRNGLWWLIRYIHGVFHWKIFSLDLGHWTMMMLLVQREPWKLPVRTKPFGAVATKIPKQTDPLPVTIIQQNGPFQVFPCRNTCQPPLLLD